MHYRSTTRAMWKSEWVDQQDWAIFSIACEVWAVSVVPNMHCIFNSRFRWKCFSWFAKYCALLMYYVNLDGLTGGIWMSLQTAKPSFLHLPCSHLCDANVGISAIWAPMLTCSNSARTKANSTRGLIISSHQIGLAHYTDKMLTQPMYQVPRWLFMEIVWSWGYGNCCITYIFTSH